MSEHGRPISVGVATPPVDPRSEAQITELVRRFYEIGRAHPVLGPLFEAAIPDWEGHMVIVADFWSKALLGTDRYRGNVFSSHMRLPVEPEHFDQWLEVFQQAAGETLPPPLARSAIARARHMTDSIRVGLFPYRDKDGKPTRKPPF
ncbi:hypothetical protein A6A04_08300 [Paramagnetospirillum marisnigri]|uniref:Preprotein translocase subunit TatC n=1 Tax=Paramagnetospirillum marisnigri TaxID=1285242 RepID=A0A178M8E8_9PROT|nr:group III truncated hemoglobin [Paramagnetospirillum marisnigri]OAN44806.1 hypothetical protein A6A04_08300 [Paramagnetospirillum marisnigri]